MGFDKLNEEQWEPAGQPVYVPLGDGQDVGASVLI